MGHGRACGPVAAAAVALLGLACTPDALPTDVPLVDTDPEPVVDDRLTEREIVLLREFWPLPAVPPDPTNAVADDPWAQHFGQYLFFETRFSSTGQISCASCHTPELGWADGTPFSNTLAPTGRHAPTLINSSYNRWHFWDGRCDTQWCQAAQPFEAANEMGGNRVAIVRTVHDDPRMREAYVDIFGADQLPDMDDPRFPEAARPLPGSAVDDLDAAWEAMAPEDRVAVDRAFTNLTKAIAAFERRIVSRDSDFDRWARAMLLDEPGRDLLSPAARRGYKHFVGDGLCIACHNGPTFSNLEFHNVGVEPPDWKVEPDPGRAAGILRVREDPFNGAGRYSDDPEFGAVKLDYLVITREQDGQFKTPGLRDLDQTGPYLHAGQKDTLEAVILNYIMQGEDPPIGHAEELIAFITMQPDAVPDVIAFLETLQGAPVPDELTRQPDDPRFVPGD